AGIQEARLRHDVGVIHRLAGDHAKAAEALEQARELYEKVPFSELARIELTRDVADVRTDAGKHDEAIALSEQATDAAGEMLRTPHPEVALAIAGLGRVADHQGDAGSARARSGEAIALVASAIGPDAMDLVALHEQLSASHARRQN